VSRWQPHASQRLVVAALDLFAAQGYETRPWSRSPNVPGWRRARSSATSRTSGRCCSVKTWWRAARSRDRRRPARVDGARGL